jgi:hypothetical protein
VILMPGEVPLWGQTHGQYGQGVTSIRQKRE